MFRCISGDVAVDVVCVLPPSAFPTSVYDSVVQRLAGAALVSPTTLRADLITGAAARSLYFPNNTAIYRFQLLHITRVASRLDGAANMRALRAGLVGAVASGIGLCGFDEPAAAEEQSPPSAVWELPSLVALVASIGWIITLILCGGCWAFYVYCSPKPVIPSAEVVPPVQQPPVIPVAILTRPEAAPPANTGRKNTESMPPLEPPSRTASLARASRRDVYILPGNQSRQPPVIIPTPKATDFIEFDRTRRLPSMMDMRLPRP